MEHLSRLTANASVQAVVQALSRRAASVGATMTVPIRIKKRWLFLVDSAAFGGIGAAAGVESCRG